MTAAPTTRSRQTWSRRSMRVRSSSGRARHPTNARWLVAQARLSVMRSRCAYRAAALPAATAPAAPANIAYLPHDCQEGAAAASSEGGGAGRAPAIFGVGAAVDEDGGRERELEPQPNREVVLVRAL